MPISDVASLIGGAALGAPVSEILKLVIEGAKHVNDFKSLFQDLASRMEVLVPVFKDIESMQQGSNPGEQKVLMIMQRADEMVRKCSSVQPYNLYKRALYTSQIKGINQDFLRFCQIELPLIQYRNQLQSMRLMARVNTQILTLSNGLPLAMNPLPYSISDGCSFMVDHRRSVNVLSVLCHPECLICHACDKPFAIQEGENYVSNSRGKFHESCYVRYCYVCKERKMRKYYQHPIWGERYCHSHETDGTPKCHSCERLEPKGTNFVMLDDGRWLCLECMDSAVMDSDECQPLHFDMREFFEGLHMKIEQQFPLLLVGKQALNKAEKEEKINKQDYEYEVVTRGICLSEAQTVTSVSQKPITGPNNKLVGMATESQRVVRECEVTAILILYGLPRLLTGYILAHEMMHAYLRLNGYRNLNNVLEEGLCQVVGNMWLESQTYATADATEASSSSPTPAANASKRGEWSDFEKKLMEFCKNQIETDESPVFGAGFRKVNQMVTNSSLQETLKEILRWG